jgi:putative transposase
MKSFLIRLYELVTAPLYRRLARDLTLQLQTVSKEFVDHQEHLATRFIDELVQLNLRIDSLEAARSAKLQAVTPERMDSDGTISNLEEQEIHEILLELKSSGDLVATCHKRNLPLSTVMEWQTKYGGLDVTSMRRVRLLEEANFELQCMLTDLVRENKNLKKEQAATRS